METGKGGNAKKITHKLFVIIVSINLLEFLRLTVFPLSFL